MTRALRWVVLIAMVGAELLVTIGATWAFWSASGRVVEEDEVPVGSTALVLGSLVDDGEPGDYVRGRLDTTLELYRSGRVDRIINSGNGSTYAGNEPAVMRTYLEDGGVAPGDIVDDPLGLDTDASCRRAHDDLGVERAVIITQDFHVSRAIALCRSHGIDATGVAAECECPTVTVLRNHVRELFARPWALVGVL
ncbi:ElyC/SanA/YdcF family protein [Gordonia sp. LSe1-13]|uniref:ElyC/SanA/YdcF family protein n=1 Tax=Gordonia sesuvii TaxID=3116777 RepID=A0ABU7MFT2_9ACTN|nr:ElyC/SanA/YdcF family protein [Gordonia sp. LSe1-13]